MNLNCLCISLTSKHSIQLQVATISRTNGISKEVISQSLGHDSLKTTGIYLDDIGDPVMDDLFNSAL